MDLKDYSDNEAVRSRGQELVSTLGGIVIRTHDGPKNPYAPLFYTPY